jgi:hypothetical protein
MAGGVAAGGSIATAGATVAKGLEIISPEVKPAEENVNAVQDAIQDALKRKSAGTTTITVDGVTQTPKPAPVFDPNQLPPAPIQAEQPLPAPPSLDIDPNAGMQPVNPDLRASLNVDPDTGEILDIDDVVNNRETDGFALDEPHYHSVQEPFSRRIYELIEVAEAIEEGKGEEITERGAIQNAPNADIINELETFINERTDFPRKFSTGTISKPQARRDQTPMAPAEQAADRPGDTAAGPSELQPDATPAAGPSPVETPTDIEPEASPAGYVRVDADSPTLPVTDPQPDDITTKAGTPFKTQSTAKLKLQTDKSLDDGLEVARVKDGYVLRQPVSSVSPVSPPESDESVTDTPKTEPVTFGSANEAFVEARDAKTAESAPQEQPEIAPEVEDREIEPEPSDTKQEFTPTHVTSDGTQVAATDEENVWIDEDGNEIEDEYATEITREIPETTGPDTDTETSESEVSQSDTTGAETALSSDTEVSDSDTGIVIDEAEVSSEPDTTPSVSGESAIEDTQDIQLGRWTQVRNASDRDNGVWGEITTDSGSMLTVKLPNGRFVRTGRHLVKDVRDNPPDAEWTSLAEIQSGLERAKTETTSAESSQGQDAAPDTEQPDTTESTDVTNEAATESIISEQLSASKIPESGVYIPLKLINIGAALPDGGTITDTAANCLKDIDDRILQVSKLRGCAK